MTISGEQLEGLYTTMVKIRRFDEKTVELFHAGLVKGTAHSYVGEEAVAAGACATLREGDYIVGTHRGHGHCIAKGARVEAPEDRQRGHRLLRRRRRQPGRGPRGAEPRRRVGAPDHLPLREQPV